MIKRVYYMLKSGILIALVAVSAAMAQPVPQQVPTKPDAAFYRLDFTWREMDDAKVINTRSYSLWLQTGDKPASVRAGSQVPVVSGGTADKPTSVSYTNTGINISCYIKEIDNAPVLTMDGSISSLVPAEKSQDTKPIPPAFMTININAVVSLSPGKAMTISSVDDPGSKHRFQLDVTATKLK